MQLAITWAKLLLFQKQCIIHQCQSIEHIELELLGEDQGIVNQIVEALFQLDSVIGLQGDGGSVVEQVGSSDGRVLGVDD